MRWMKVLLFLVIAAGAAFAQTAQHGIYTEDIDKKADPCTDFFQYSNGAWRAANPIPASMSRWSRRWASGEQSKEQLKTILEEVTARKDWKKGSVEQSIGDYYGSCMDESKINQQGMTPIELLLAEIDGIKNAGDLQKVIAHLHELQVNAPFGLIATSDNHEPTQVIADIYASGLGLPDRDYYLKDDARFKEAREKYRAHLASMFKLLGYDEKAAKEASDTVFEFETNLAKAQLDNVELRDPAATDHKTKFADLGKMVPHFDWAAYYKRVGVGEADLNVDQPKFMAEVERQLAQTPLPAWKTYLKWQLVNSAAPSLSAPFVETDFAFYGKYLSGAAEMKPRWKRCVESADANLGEALGQKYVERYFPPEAKARMQDMVKNLLAGMKQTIDGLGWMSPETKTKALEKLSTFNPKIGYPDKWKDYSKVPIGRDSYWANVVAGRKFNFEDDHNTINKPVDRGRWGMTPPTSDAYYNPLLNEIVFPAGILQPPAFRMDATDAVNYGAIGVVIGHEISHGFDDQGAQYDAQGRLKNWWTPDDYKRFQAKAQCVVNQFDNYFIEPNIHHNGKLVLGESIGDLAGAKIAYVAYQISRKGKGPEPTIDGFTPEQQFFVSWGQFRGDEIRPETQRLMVQGDPHPIAKYRVIGPVSNLPAFQEAFQCKAGSPMVRAEAERCEVW